MTASHATDLLCRSQGAIPISPEFFHLFEQLNEPWGMKDLESRFIYANAAYIELLALPKNFDITGRLDSELPAPTSEFAEEFQAHDRLVECERQRKSSLEIHPFGREHTLQAYFFDKYPTYNKKGEINGTMFHGRRAEHLPLEFYTCQKSNSCISLMLTRPAEIFTDSEWRIIFYILQGKTQKQISILLGLSTRYVNKRIQGIFDEVNVSSSLHLIEFCHKMGWQNYVPESLLALGHMLI